jgi:hypothetical protein
MEFQSVHYESCHCEQSEVMPKADSPWRTISLPGIVCSPKFGIRSSNPFPNFSSRGFT